MAIVGIGTDAHIQELLIKGDIVNFFTATVVIIMIACIEILHHA